MTMELNEDGILEVMHHDFDYLDSTDSKGWKLEQGHIKAICYEFIRSRYGDEATLRFINERKKRSK